VGLFLVTKSVSVVNMDLLLKNITIIHSVEETKRWISSPQLERLEDIKRLGFGKSYFELTAFTASNGKHFPFVNHPDHNLIKRVQDEIRTYLDQITEKDYYQLAKLIKSKASDDEILLFYTKLSGDKFGKCKVDKSFLKNARKLPTVADIYESGSADQILNNESRIMRAKEKIISYSGDDYIRIHNCIASLLPALPMLKKAVLEKHKSIFQIIAENAPIKYAVRVVKEPVIIDGKHLRPGNVVLFNIAKAARQTGDTRYTFGQGTDERRCPFGFFMENFLEKLRSSSLL